MMPSRPRASRVLPFAVLLAALSPLAGAAQLSFVVAESEKMGTCQVVTDPALDQAPSLDIVSAEMFVQGSRLGIRITMTDLAVPTADTGYWVHWVDGNGVGYYAGGYSLATAGNEAPLGMTPDVGTYDPGSGAYTWYGEGAFDSGIAEISGNTITVLVDPSYVGSPSGELTGIGARSGEALNYFEFDGTTSDGSWTVGEECGKAADAGLKAGDGPSGSGAAGAFGGLLMLLSLAGLRRRQRG